MPGMKDYKSIVKNGKRTQGQKRLLLFNLNDLHKHFREKFPEIPISLLKFRQIRPRKCILAGKIGTHNVCVCNIHQNMKLKLHGMMQQLKIKGVDFTDTYHDFINNSVCENVSSNCFFSTCEECAKTKLVIEKLKILLEETDFTEVNFSQWTSTDRYFIVHSLMSFIYIFRSKFLFFVAKFQKKSDMIF